MTINKKILLLCGAGHSSAAIANAIIDRFGEIDILEETGESSSNLPKAPDQTSRSCLDRRSSPFRRLGGAVAAANRQGAH